MSQPAYLIFFKWWLKWYLVRSTDRETPQHEILSNPLLAIPLRPKYFLSSPFRNTATYMRDQLLHPHITKGKSVVLYIFIFRNTVFGKKNRKSCKT
jgi:hypothetical protein